MNWNYEQDSTQLKLTDEFKSKYIIRIKDKEYILSDGLKSLAHEKGIKQLTTHILQMPNKENHETCIVEAKLIGYDFNPMSKEVQQVEYIAIGDANIGNCNKQVASSFIRVAETRAVCRVLKNYTNIGLVAFEELGTGVLEEVVVKMTDSQRKEIQALMKGKSLTPENVKKISKTVFGVEKPAKDLTSAEADVLIKKIKSLPTPKDNDETVIQ